MINPLRDLHIKRLPNTSTIRSRRELRRAVEVIKRIGVYPVSSWDMSQAQVNKPRSALSSSAAGAPNTVDTPSEQPSSTVVKRILKAQYFSKEKRLVEKQSKACRCADESSLPILLSHRAHLHPYILHPQHR